MTERNAYVDKMQAKVDEWSAEIAKLEARARGAEADARINCEEQLQRMRKQRDEAQAHMRELQRASDEAFDDVRAGFESAWDSMADAFRKATQRFK